ncbi:MAG: amylo-alpha-1,6-glucosidase [Pseudomonadota bacterium]
MEEHEVDPYHVVASPSRMTEGRRVLKCGDTFVVLSRAGDVHGARGEEGLYHRGTKHVSRLEFRIGKYQPLLLSSSMPQNNLLLAVDLTNPDIYEEDRLIVPYGTVHIARTKFLREGSLFERVLLSNYGTQAMEVEFSWAFGADFVDIFEVRGTKRERRGQMLPPEVGSTSVVLAYRGLDDVVRKTRFEFVPAPDRIEKGAAFFRTRLESRQTRILYLRIGCHQGEGEVPAAPPYETVLSQLAARAKEREQRECQIFTSNEQLNDWLNRSQADLRLLTTETRHGPYPYAGVPWFSTPFGRDGIWTALEALWLDPALAEGVLRFLSAHQATEVDPAADAAPGKIVHELRDGEMAALGEIPFGRYYGSVDSTLLYLMLADRYHRTTADRALIESIWPNLLAAVEWMERYGDADGDGFIEYGRQSPKGLVQQGWKDSNDSVFHADGTPAPGPIALCEVQAYAYAAYVGMARLARVVGESARAEEWLRRASELKSRFDSAFWCDDLSTYALALDGNKLPCRVKTSNAGHCLYTGIALPERVAPLIRTLMSEQMFSGWGVRTLASDEQCYNPMSYHNGSIWPHDNAILAEGFAAYGHQEEAASLLAAMFDASLFMDLHRLPELFCGFPRQLGQAPTRYPVACSPQAWASAAAFSFLGAVLGLSIDAAEARVVFRHPMLPPFIEHLTIRNLRVGPGAVDLRLHRYPEDVGITVVRTTGQVEIVVLK